MRRIASYLLSVIIALSGITALAAEPETVVKDVYNHSDNSVSASEAGVTGTYSTVMIRKETNGEVVYVNQESGRFSDLTTFLMKDGCEDGNYIATFGNEKGETKTIKFFRGGITVQGVKSDGTSANVSFNLNTSTKMTVADKAQLQTNISATGIDVKQYYKGFTLLVENMDAYKKAYLVSGDGKTCYGYFELPKPDTTITGPACIAYGLQLFNIPKEKKDLNLYLGGAPE